MYWQRNWLSRKVLSKQTLGEQFGFLEGKQIREAVRIARESLHSIKTRNQILKALKFNLSKAYDRVS
jgi:hypothetical protein